MYKVCIIVLLSLMVLCCVCDQDVPLNKIPYGFSIGDLQGSQ